MSRCQRGVGRRSAERLREDTHTVERHGVAIFVEFVGVETIKTADPCAKRQRDVLGVHVFFPWLFAGKEVIVVIVVVRKVRADPVPSLDGFRCGFEDWEPSSEATGFVVVVDHDGTVGVSSEAASFETGDLGGAASGIAQEDVGGREHDLALFVVECAVADVTAAGVNICVELALDVDRDRLTRGFLNPVVRDHMRSTATEGHGCLIEVAVEPAVLDDLAEPAVEMALVRCAVGLCV